MPRWESVEWQTAGKVAQPVLVGCVAGIVFDCFLCSNLIAVSLLVGLFFAVAGLFAGIVTVRHPRAERLSGLALIAYVAILLAPEVSGGRTVLQTHSVAGAFKVIAWYSPLLLGWVLARPLELTRWAWWLALFAATVVLSYDAVGSPSSIGFGYVIQGC
jgi:hypothetical protein